MDAAVTQFFVMQIGFLCPFARQFGNAGNRFTLFFRVEDFLLQDVGSFGTLVQVIIEFLLQEIVNILADRNAVRRHLFRAQLRFCLRLEYRLFHFNTDACHHAVADVGIFEIPVVVLFDDTGCRFAEGRQVRPPLRGVLPVYKRVIFFAILIGVRNRDFYIFTGKVDDGIEQVGSEILIE